MEKIYIIDAEDERCRFAKRYLEERGMTCVAAGTDTDYGDSVKRVYLYSPAKKWESETFRALSDNSAVYAGAADDKISNLIRLKKINYKNMLRDEKFVLKNAEYTAEAALMMIIGAVNTSIFELNHAVIGYGRVGKAMARLFKLLGVNFTVATDNALKAADAVSAGIRVCPVDSDYSGYGVIVNTVPARAITPHNIELLRGESYILELASYHIISDESANACGLNYVAAPRLPGRFMPRSAGIALAKRIMEMEEGYE